MRRPTDHKSLVDALRRRVLDGSGETNATLRTAVAERAGGGPALELPYDELARQIGAAAYRVTDAQVRALVEKVGERAVFEVICAAATGAGLHRWNRGLAVLADALNAPC